MTTRGHDCRHVRLDDGSYVLECSCGWESIPSPYAAVVGSDWDVHLATAARTDGS